MKIINNKLKNIRKLLHIFTAVSIIATIIFPTTTFGRDKAPNQGNTNYRRTDYQPGGVKCNLETITRLGSGPKSNAERDRCAAAAEEHRQNEESIHQETRSANIAENGLHVAIKQLHINIVQIVVSAFTFLAAAIAALYAGIAATQARRSADAAAKALTHSEHATNLQLRAYVGFDHGFLDCQLKQLRIFIKNFGQTPAKNVKVKTSYIDQKNATHQGDHSFGFIDPQSSAEALIILNNLEPKNITPELYQIIIQVTIMYTDISGNRHTRSGNYHAPPAYLNRKGKTSLHILSGTAREHEEQAGETEYAETQTNR